MPPVSRPCVILSRRRTGAGDIYKLLEQHLPWKRLGSEPFFWDRPLGYIAQQYARGEIDAARTALGEELRKGLFFKHQYETESWDFNLMLFEHMAELGYGAILFERRDEHERLFSLVVAQTFSAWARDGIDGLRERIRRGDLVPVIDLDAVRTMVRQEMAYQCWFDANYARFGIDTLRLSYEDFYRNGLAALPLADALFAFAGAGVRESVLDDASLLRFIFGGEHHTMGLLAYSDALRQAHAVILDELQQDQSGFGALTDDTLLAEPPTDPLAQPPAGEPPPAG